MKTKTVTVNEGELLGPIDWSFDFSQSFHCMCTNEDRKREECERKKALLKQAEEMKATGKPFEARFGDYWHEVFDVGMYDGWPFWKPYPALFVHEFVLGGGTWQFFYELSELRFK